MHINRIDSTDSHCCCTITTMMHRSVDTHEISFPDVYIQLRQSQLCLCEPWVFLTVETINAKESVLWPHIGAAHIIRISSKS